MLRRIALIGLFAALIASPILTFAQENFNFDVTTMTYKLKGDDGVWTDWSEKIEVGTMGKFIQSESKIIIYGEESNSVYNLKGEATTEKDEDGTTYMSFNAVTNEGTSIEVTFMFFADDEVNFILALSVDKMILAYNCNF